MKKALAFGTLVLLAVIGAGCGITDYPIITDTRGSYDGVIRTGHKAYIVPTGQVATIWNDGSDELYTLVSQNQYGDQMLYLFNNFDPTGSVNFMDQTYCDWRYEGCPSETYWNPADPNIDDPFDYDIDWNCSGIRSECVWVSMTSRIGECGDGLFWADKQDLFAEFANLAKVPWRGEHAYLLPLNVTNTTITLTAPDGSATLVPLFGQFTGYITEKLQLVLPVTPNARHQLRWMSGYVAEHGKRATATVGYGSVSAEIEIAFNQEGLIHNANRF
jgi:hypothetical protein